MTTKYPVYIVSKGRWDNPITAKFMMEDGVDFMIVVEPQEYDNYCKNIPKENILITPFSNLGLGSYPARNFAWEHALKNGHKRYWCFDDNIYRTRQLFKGKKIPCDSLNAIKMLEEFTDRYENVAITSFSYSMFVVGTQVNKPFYLNHHAYSAMLIKTQMKHRWRMKYNEDVDLCLQVLHDRMCIISSNVLMVDKVSTTAKMKGGNQTELYKGNSHDKKVLKAKSLELMWPQYCKTVFRFNRPHHFVDWSVFNHPLIRRDDINWNDLENKKVPINIKIIKNVKSNKLKNFIKNNKSR